MRWEALARAQGGVIALRQLRECALSEAGIDGLIRRRDLVEVHAGVYRQHGTPDTDLGRSFAATLWCGGFLSYASAAPTWNLPITAGPRVQVTVPDLRFRGRARGVRVYRVQLPDHDVVLRDGLPITTRTRTIVDLLGVLPLPSGRDLAGHCLRKGWLTVGDLDRRLHEGKGRSGNVRIRRLREEADPRAHAEFERRVHTLLRERGITGWEPQYSIAMPSGQAIEADIVFPERKLVIELDGWAWHDRDRFRKDRRRWRGAVAMGWRVVQFTWDDLDHPDRMVAEIVQLLAA